MYFVYFSESKFTYIYICLFLLLSLFTQSVQELLRTPALVTPVNQPPAMATKTIHPIVETPVSVHHASIDRTVRNNNNNNKLGSIHMTSSVSALTSGRTTSSSGGFRSARQFKTTNTIEEDKENYVEKTTQAPPSLLMQEIMLL